MKRSTIALCSALLLVPLGACADYYGYDEDIYASRPYAYDGFYDGFYGPIYDGYWGDDDFFYFRRGDRDRHFQRGDHAHFRRAMPADGRFRPMQGMVRPERGMHMPHFRPGRPSHEDHR